MSDVKYTEEHEWLEVEGDIVTVGITEHATEQLGDLVFVELPEVGATVTKDDEIVVIESVKAASDIRAPLDGEIVEEVGVRKKGFLGSMDTERPSLKIKFGEYVEGQELQGLKRMTLNNSRQDPSLLRQCLAYGLFGV